MPTRNTREKRVAKKNVKNLLVDEIAFRSTVARNLSLLAGDVLSDEEKKTPDVMGIKLIEAVDLLPMTEHMVIVKYYGLIGPKYKPVSLSAIATEHHTSIKVITDLKNSALKRLGTTSYKTLYLTKVREAAEQKIIHSQNFVDISFLYKGFKDTLAYRILKQMGISYIHELAECDANELANRIDMAGLQLRYCDLLGLKNKAQNKSFSDEFLDTVAIDSQDGRIFQYVVDLEPKLGKDTIEALHEADVYSICEFLNLSESDVRIAVMGNVIQIEEIRLVRETLGFPVRD